MLSPHRLVDLFLKAGEGCAFLSPIGETRLQAESFSRCVTVYAVVILCSGVILASVAGCHRSPAPDVVATVNGKDILRADLERVLQGQPGRQSAETLRRCSRHRRLKVLHQMIEDEILQQRAAKLNLAASDEDVNAKLTEMKAPFTQEEFDKQLKQRNMTLDDLQARPPPLIDHRPSCSTKRSSPRSTSPTPRSATTMRRTRPTST